MVHRIFIVTSIIIFSFANLFAQDSSTVSQNKGNLTLVVSGLENDEGNVKIALSNSKEDYTKKGKAYIAVSAEIKNKKAQWTFTDLPFGTYAIKTFHDENNDGELDTNFLGIPSEYYGFSNNARGSFGPASWEVAKFEFNENELTLEITID